MRILIALIVFFLAVPLAFASDQWPASQDALPTTDGDIYLGNLDQRIDALADAHTRTPSAASAASLAGALYHRYRVRGGLADAERAFVLADEALRTNDPDPEHYVLRATLYSGFHRFADALVDLDAAQALGMSADALMPARRDLALSQGKYRELSAMMASSDRTSERDFYGIAFDAHVLQLKGDSIGASKLYAQAQDAYIDTSPVPLAWLYVQQGAAILDTGDARRARHFFSAAYDRLPGYTLATEHLAETEALLGNVDRARTLYEEAIAASDDPAFIDALAKIEREAGNENLASQLEKRAREGWDTRLIAYPFAFSGHAIDYFIERGDTQRALALAHANIEQRRDIESLALLAEAESAAGNVEQACVALREAKATGFATPSLNRFESTFGRDCR